MITDLLILIICSFAIALLGLLVFVRNPTQPNNRRFAILSVALMMWTIANYLSYHSLDYSLFFTRLTFSVGVLSIYTLIIFIAHFPNDKLYKNSKLLMLFTLFTALMLPITFLPSFVASVGTIAGDESITTSFMYPVFIVYIVCAVGLLAKIIRKQNKKAQTSSQKDQVRIISWGIIAYAIFAIFFNVLLPLIINNWSSSRYGPAFTLLFVGVVAYSIAKHRLFDIRLVVARSLGYILSLAVVVSIYSAAAFALAQSIESLAISFQQAVFFAIFSVIIALVFQPIKHFFDKATNKIFYRDAYDPQELLNELNASLVSTNEINDLLDKSASIIQNSIRSQFVTFALFDIETGVQYLRGTHTVKASAAEEKAMLSYTETKTEHTILTDEINNTSVKKLLNKFQVTLTSKLIIGDKTIGYLMLGDRKSGNAYSDRDIQLLETVADSVAIAAQNALRFEEIAQFNVTLQKKVDDATSKLQKSNEKLMALDEAKDEFISMASHQLRTPLTSVKGYISMMLEGDTGKLNGKQQIFLDQAYISSQRMVYLIADLLNVSRLKTGKFIIEAKPTYLPDVVESEINQLQETAKGRELDLVFDKPKTFPMMNIDETKVRQVIMNFADNAIYYTPKGGRIVIGLKATPSTVELTVKDDGIGVPKSEQHHLFTKFYRAGNAKQARPDGTGLGLFMAKKVIAAQGGAILFNTTEGKGSTFGFTLPRTKLEIKP